MEDHHVNGNINYKRTILNSYMSCYVKLPEGTRGQHLLLGRCCRCQSKGRLWRINTTQRSFAGGRGNVKAARALHLVMLVEMFKQQNT